MPTTIEIDVRDRWDAVALMERLDPYHPFLIQSAPNALAASEDSPAARHLECAAVRVDRRDLRSRRRREGAAMSRAGEAPAMNRFTQLFLITAFAAAAMLALRAPAARPAVVAAHAHETQAAGFRIAGRESAVIAPGEESLLRVTFRRAGSYPYRRMLPGHADAGMKGVLEVTR